VQTKQFSQIVSCTTKIHKNFVSTKFQQLYFFANHVATTRSHASLRSRAPVGFLSHPPSLCLDFRFFYAYARFSILLFNAIISSSFPYPNDLPITTTALEPYNNKMLFSVSICNFIINPLRFIFSAKSLL
jgi:hypothetical protein